MAEKKPTPTTFEEANELGLKIAEMTAQLVNAGCLGFVDGYTIVAAVGEGIEQKFGPGEDGIDPDAIKGEVEEVKTDG